MNASTATLTRENDVRSKIRMVSTFSRFARVVCSALFGFGLVAGVVMFLLGALTVVGVLPPAVDTTSDFTLQQKMWGLPAGAIVVGVWLAVVHQLYRLFGNLAAGAIYTAENVGRVRRIGLLWMLGAVLSIAIPFAWASLVAMGFIEPSNPPKLEVWLSWSNSLGSLASGGLVLLVSWVMDVGLYEKDHADELKRDADLVI